MEWVCKMYIYIWSASVYVYYIYIYICICIWSEFAKFWKVSALVHTYIYNISISISIWILYKHQIYIHMEWVYKFLKSQSPSIFWGHHKWPTMGLFRPSTGLFQTINGTYQATTGTFQNLCLGRLVVGRCLIRCFLPYTTGGKKKFRIQKKKKKIEFVPGPLPWGLFLVGV